MMRLITKGGTGDLGHMTASAEGGGASQGASDGPELALYVKDALETRDAFRASSGVVEGRAAWRDL
jgi:hypothetical protein